MEDAMSEPRVEIRWRDRRGQALGLCAAVPFAAFLLHLAFNSAVFQPVHRVLMAGFALGIGYVIAAQLVNTTRISVREGRVRVEHGPLPFRANLEVAVADIRGIAVDVPSGRLRLRTREGEEIDLVDGVPAGRSSEINEAFEQL
jgi:hypothetical protein